MSMSLKVKGFRFSGVASGIKADGKLDLGLIAADAPASGAGVFTQNKVRAAPVEIGERRLRSGECQAVLVNSGNANACTGVQGREAATTLTRVLAKRLGCKASLVLPSSTGVIGVQLPASRMEQALPALTDELSPSGARTFAESILTTDRGPKIVQTTFRVGATRCNVLGIAKGAGMIHPNMATTLAFAMTDAAVSPSTLRRTLARAADQTFNRATVDGDTSTNDTLVALASGSASSRPVAATSKAGRAMAAALTEVLGELAQKVVADGEGAEHLVRIDVIDARSAQAALAVARTTACSLLVKTALHGCDPNWGRILAAVGRAGVPVREDRISIRIGSVPVYENGGPVMTKQRERRATAVMNKSRYGITISLGQGKASSHYWTCDVGHEYVRINADYRT